MLRLRRATLPALLAAAVILPAAAASAATYTYDLNGSLASSTGGPSLVSDGGSLGPSGYSFGPNQGLTLGPVGGAPVTSYSIAVDFYFTNADTARGNGYRKIIDFSGLTSDNGLYTHNSAVSLYNFKESGGIVFGTLSTLTIDRSSTGLVAVDLNGSQLFTYQDTTDQFNFSNVSSLHFFEDDTSTGRGEAGTGFVDSIVVKTNGGVSPVPLPASAPMFGAALLGLAGLGYAAKLRKATTAA